MVVNWLTEWFDWLTDIYYKCKLYMYSDCYQQHLVPTTKNLSAFLTCYLLLFIFMLGKLTLMHNIFCNIKKRNYTMNNIFHTENVEIILLTWSLLPDNQNAQRYSENPGCLWQIEDMSFISLSGLHVCGKHTWSDKLWISSISVRPCSSCGTAPGSMSFSAENNPHGGSRWHLVQV